MYDIVIKGAREHNLKDIDLVIPRGKFVVLTGLSGSGKSTLAFDTIYAEGQRRYMESLSAYARQFIEQLKKPEVESIEGLSPTISIDQRGLSRNPRSTVGTVTEIYDYLRLLFSKKGVPYCLSCNKPIATQTVEQMLEKVVALPQGRRITIVAPIVRGRKGEYGKELRNLKKMGYPKVKIDGVDRNLDEPIKLDRKKVHTIEVNVDRLAVKPEIDRRLDQSVRTALGLAGGVIRIDQVGAPSITFSEKFACPDCGFSFAEITPRVFSFNNPHGACPTCHGLGVKIRDEDLALEGEEFEDVDPEVFKEVCTLCGGSRLKEESLAIRLDGKSIYDIAQGSISENLKTFKGLQKKWRGDEVAELVIKEIHDRLQFLEDVGVGYLTLDRPSATLSGGEGQRLRLATQVGSNLVGVLYVLDEPSIGLHAHDHHKLLNSLRKLRDEGNSILVVEHDEQTIRGSDYVIDMGPGGGTRGGKITALGTPAEVEQNTNSETGNYLSGRKSIPVPKRRRKPTERILSIKGASGNNLKDLSIDIPIGLFTCITGVSGSGKSTLIIDTLFRYLSRKINRSKDIYLPVRSIEGLEHLERVINIDQRPIGRTPRSNPATYTGVFTHIRSLFAQLPESKVRGYRAGRYSFNVSGGRCDACSGDGLTRIEMHFLPDVYVQCEVCAGRRYNRQTLEVCYKNKNIADVLEMTVSEAAKLFENIPSISRILKTLVDVGIGYITLGQSATTLSGGEAQRIKLAKELSKRSKGRSLYLLDEPTTGLHFADIHKLLEVLNRLVQEGNTVLVIEHNFEVIKVADYLIDLGPGGGESGGQVVGKGTPETLAKNAKSLTGGYLKEKIL